MRKRILATPLLVIIIFILVGIGGATAAILLGGGGASNQEVSLQKGLIGHWKMDGNAKDWTVNANHGAVTEAILTTDRKGQSNKAYSFDGVNDKIVIPYDASLIFPSKLTISWWIYIDPLSAIMNGNVKHLFDANTGGTGGFNWYWEDRGGYGDNRVYSRIFGATISSIYTTADTAGWYHFVETYDKDLGGTEEHKLYKNGVQAASADFSETLLPLTLDIWIGGQQNLATFSEIKVDEVRIYNRALSATEITALYQSYDPGIQVSDLQKGLVGQWKFDGNAKDSTPYANNGTVTGATLVNDRKGQALKAYSFDGTDDYVDVGSNSSLFPTNAVTLAFWAYIDPLAAGINGNINHIVSAGYSTGGYDIWFEDRGDPYGTNRVGCSMRGTSNYACADAGDNSITSAGWYFLAMTYDKDLGGTEEVKFYINGVKKGTGDFSEALMTPTTPFIIGGYSSVSPPTTIDGPYTVDDVRVYNRALSQTEITALYESYDPGIVVSDLQKGLVGQWKMDGNMKDSTPYANNGTAGGSPTLVSDRKGQALKAYSFDGVDDYVDVGNTASLQNIFDGGGTIIAWVKPNNTINYNGIVTKRTLAAFGWSFYMTGSTNLSLTILHGFSTQYGLWYAAGVVPVGSWTMVAVTYDNSNVANDATLYVNGATVSQGEVTPIGTRNTDVTWNMVIGNTGSNEMGYTGEIDEVRIYNRALSQTEITALYESY